MIDVIPYWGVCMRHCYVARFHWPSGVRVAPVFNSKRWKFMLKSKQWRKATNRQTWECKGICNVQGFHSAWGIHQRPAQIRHPSCSIFSQSLLGFEDWKKNNNNMQCIRRTAQGTLPLCPGGSSGDIQNNPCSTHTWTLNFLKLWRGS